MKTLPKTVTTVAILICLTACNRAERNDLRAERRDRLYRAAMDDYSSGRLDAAITGLEKAVRNDPSNASARFQLACLHQDVRKDHLKAYLGFREYLLQHPESDKAKLAKDRLQACEKEVARVLAAKYGLSKADVAESELAALRKDLAEARRQIAAMKKEVEVERGRNDALKSEKQRLLNIVKSESDDQESLEPSHKSTVAKDAKDLLDEDEDSDRIKIADEIAQLRKEGEDEISASSALLPERKADDVAKRDADRAAAKEKSAASAAPSHPDTYVVQEGDTLYRIATKFYGTMHAWKAIQNANKALISTDGRVRAGDTIKLP